VTALLQHLVDALSVGSTYALLALGLTLLFSVMGLINFAYGDLIVWCGYLLSALEGASVSFWWSIPILLAFATLLSLAIWFLAFRPFRDAPPITLLLTSFGVALALEALALLVFGPDPRAYSVPESLSRVWTVGGVRISLIEAVTVGAALGVVVALELVLRQTTLGMELVATAEDRGVTQLMGVRTGKVLLSAFAISGAIAGVVAVLELPRLGAVTSDAGLDPTISAFVAVILGGLGSVRGAIAGGLVLGALETGFAAWLPSNLLSYQDAFVFVLVIVLVTLRPGGLVGRVAEVTR
jgi:branched-chain amino acid transport system permease protein